jgi:hypothetical protein
VRLATLFVEPLVRHHVSTPLEPEAYLAKCQYDLMFGCYSDTVGHLLRKALSSAVNLTSPREPRQSMRKY